DLVIQIAKHEALHYALYKLGLPYEDGEDYFEKELEKHGLVSSFISPKLLGLDQKYWVWKCMNCDKVVVAKSKKTTKDYGKYSRSNCCKAPLKESGWEIL